jgi:hypothetical protein
VGGRLDQFAALAQRKLDHDAAQRGRVAGECQPAVQHGAVSNAATVSVTVKLAPTPTPTPTAGPTATPVPVRVSVQRAGANRLLVTIAAPGPIDRVAWPAVPNVAVETVDGTPITGGVLTVPASSTTALFYIRKLSGSSVTLPLTVTGVFGTWQTFVGGGPNAW